MECVHCFGFPFYVEYRAMGPPPTVARASYVYHYSIDDTQTTIFTIYAGGYMCISNILLLHVHKII